MKKLVAIFAIAGIITFGSGTAFSQAQKYLNIGLIGVSYEIPVATDITIAPAAYTDFNFNYLSLGVKANYYFDSLFGLTDPWDIYGGLNGGYAFGLNGIANDFAIGLQVGGRWFWSDKWGVYLEASGGNLGAAGGIGVTMKL